MFEKTYYMDFLRHLHYPKKEKPLNFHLLTLTSVRTSPNHTSFPLVTSHFSQPMEDCDPHSAQAPPTYTHKAFRTTTVVDIRVVSCDPPKLQFTNKKQQATLTTHTHKALTQHSRHGNLHGSLPCKKWHHWARIQLCLSPYFREVLFFCDSVFLENCPGGCRVVGRSFRVVLLTLLLGGAAWPPPWGVAAILPGSGVFPSCALSSHVFFIFWEPAPPKGGRRRQHDQKEEEAKQPHPQGREGKAAPLKGRRRDHDSTETELNFS